MSSTVIIVMLAIALSILTVVMVFTVARMRRQAASQDPFDPDEKIGHDEHQEQMLKLGQRWAMPTTIVFSINALITMAGLSFNQIVQAITHHQLPNLIQVATLLTAFVIVVAMDLVLLNAAANVRNSRMANRKPERMDLTLMWTISIIEACTFAYVAFQLDNPPNIFHGHPTLDMVVTFLVLVTFIIMRAVAAPICAIYLGTLGKRPVSLREAADIVLLRAGKRMVTMISDKSIAFEIDELAELMIAAEETRNAENQEATLVGFRKIITFYAGKRTNDAAKTAVVTPELPKVIEVVEVPQENTVPLLGSVGAASFENTLGNIDQGNGGAPDPAPAAPTAAPFLTLLPNTDAAQGSSDDDDGDEDAEEVVIAPPFQGKKPLGKSYRLPDGLTLATELPASKLQPIFGISDSTLDNRWKAHEIRMTIMPRREGNKKLWEVGDILRLYEAGVFDGLDLSKFENMALVPVA